MATRDYFVFAGEIYARTPAPSAAPLLTRLLRALRRPSSGTAEMALLAAATGALATALIAAELLPRLWAGAFAHKGVPKLSAPLGASSPSGSAASPQARAVEGKGQEERAPSAAALAGKLKSLSAVMSAERAAGTAAGTAAGAAAGAAAPAPRPAEMEAGVRDLLVTVNKIVGQAGVQHRVASAAKELQRLLRDFMVLPEDRDEEAAWADLRRAWADLAKAATQTAPHVHNLLAAAHRGMLQQHERVLEARVVPGIAANVREALREAVEVAPEPNLMTAWAAVKELHASPRLLHELVAVSVALSGLREAPKAKDAVATARAQLGRLTGIADELMATKVLLHAARSVHEMCALVEGYALRERAMAASRACMRLWPEAINLAPAATPAAQLEPEVPPLAVLVRLHILVRREQMRRASLPALSIHDVAIWKHLVNACDEISGLAFSSPGELRFGAAAAAFVASLADVVEQVVVRHDARPPVGRDARMSFDSLMTDSDMRDRRSTLTDLPSVTLLRSVRDCNDPQAQAVMRAVRAHVTRLVDDLLPGGTAGVSVGESTGGAVVASVGDVDQEDVLVCFVMGAAAAQTAKQLVFVRESVPPRTQTALLEHLERLAFADCLPPPREMPPPQRHLADDYDALCAMLTSLPAGAVAELPATLRARVQHGDDETLSAAATVADLPASLRARVEAGAEIKRLLPAGVTAVVDALSLRLDGPRAGHELRVYPTSLDGEDAAVVCLFLPDIVAVLARSRERASGIATTLQNFSAS